MNSSYDAEKVPLTKFSKIGQRKQPRFAKKKFRSEYGAAASTSEEEGDTDSVLYNAAYSETSKGSNDTRNPFNGLSNEDALERGSRGSEIYRTTMEETLVIDDEEVDEHCHAGRVFDDSALKANKKARRVLTYASLMCLGFMFAEIVGGIWSNSLAILTDAAHLLTDFASFMISLFALFMATRRPSRRMNFGWHRAEVIGAVMSVLMIWVITGILVYLAAERVYTNEFEVDAEIMLITAAIGVSVNLIMGLMLHFSGHGHSHGGGGGGHGHSHGGGGAHGHSHGGGGAHGHSHDSGGNASKKPKKGGSTTTQSPTVGTARSIVSVAGQSAASQHSHGHSHHLNPAKKNAAMKECQEKKTKGKMNINVRAAFIHVVGDFIQSTGVLVAAYIIYYHPHLKIMDPICTFVFSLLVLYTTIQIMKDALRVLMEGTPRGIDFEEVHTNLLQIEEILAVHNIRIWSLTLDKSAFSAHLAISEASDAHAVLKKASMMLRKNFNVYDCTLQIEKFTAGMENCEHCENPES